jgi:hypothetical protein
MGAPSPRDCSKGSFCNATVSEDGAIIWGATEEPCSSGSYCPRRTIRPLPCVTGATCVVPASPELILEPPQFEVIESEVVARGGHLQYNLSLSAVPAKKGNNLSFVVHRHSTYPT